MEEKLKKVPKLRFKDENGEDFPAWEWSCFGNVFEFMDYGMNAASKVFDGMNIYLRITDINEESHRFLDIEKVSPSGTLQNKYLLTEQDIVFARTGASTGKTYLYRREDGVMYFAGYLIRGRVKASFNTKFIFLQSLRPKYYKWVSIMSIRSGQPGINMHEYQKYKFMLPTLPEQTRIADFFTKLDEQIEVEKAILEKWKLLKKGFLQQMFI